MGKAYHVEILSAAVKKLKDSEYYRLRVGDWRVIFAIADPRKLVTVIAVERRTSTTY